VAKINQVLTGCHDKSGPQQSNKTEFIIFLGSLLRAMVLILPYKNTNF
jgi:hypothetical protein